MGMIAAAVELAGLISSIAETPDAQDGAPRIRPAYVPLNVNIPRF
jgi:hypothetical protein